MTSTEPRVPASGPESVESKPSQEVTDALVTAAIRCLREAGWSLTRSHVYATAEEARDKGSHLLSGDAPGALTGLTPDLHVHVHLRPGAGDGDEYTLELEERLESV